MSSESDSSHTTSSTPQTGERVLLKVPRRAMMKVFERQAVRFFDKHTFNMNHEEYIQKKFISSVKKSPSTRTVGLAIAVAAEAGWHEALKELFSIDLSPYKTVRSRKRQHPMMRKIVSGLQLPGVCDSNDGEAYVRGALIRAITMKRLETVRIMTKHMDFADIDAMQDKPLLHYVYSLDEQDIKKHILNMILPKLKPLSNMEAAAKHGDLESVKYFAEKLETKDLHRIVYAGREAIANGHDHVARWIMETTGITDSGFGGASLLKMAVDNGNLDIIEHVSEHPSSLLPNQVDCDTTSKLWSFLQRENRTELFAKLFPSHPEGPLTHSIKTQMSQLSLEREAEQAPSAISLD